MNPAQPGEAPVVQGLDPERKSIDTGTVITQQLAGGDRARIRLQADFGVAAQTEQPIGMLQNQADGARRQQRRRPAAEKNGRERSLPAVAMSFLLEMGNNQLWEAFKL
ncbi:hypothetical protein A6070_00705 [Syntrophotalea acetylenica]|nr:hypothetical protein [Syntrophotalea acetylenica]APG42818.1 hypothetical protein A6070_00705 [Syntrophotalea acetylenica]